MKLVETLEAQHRALERMVGELDAALAHGELERVNHHLGRLRHALLTHLELENSQFYPRIFARAEQGAGDLSVVQLFSDNMKVIASSLTAFFAKYEDKAFTAEDFKRDWRSVLAALGKRMRDEERTLHPIYTRLVATADA